MLKHRFFRTTALISAILVLLLVGGCENALTGILQAIEDQIFSLAAPIATPAAETTITAHEIIRINFQETINKESLAISGDMSANFEILGWESAAYTDDTVYIKPSVGNFWPAGIDQNITITCVNIPESGEKARGLRSYELSWNIFNGVCVVSPDGEDNEIPSGTSGYLTTGQGSAWFPKKTIPAGITKASNIYSSESEVRIAYNLDPYTVNSDWPEYDIILQPGISLIGGYDKETWTYTQPGITPTVIEDNCTTSPTGSVIFATDPSIGNETFIRNLTLKVGFGTGDMYGLYLLDAAPTIQNITIIGRAGVSTDTTTGIHTEGNGPIIENCVVFDVNDWQGTNYPTNSIGINIRSASTVSKTRIIGGNSRISGGKATDDTVGIKVSENGSIISGITVDGGDPTGSGLSVSKAIYCEDAGAYITGNNIDCSLTSGLSYAAGIEIVNLTNSMSYFPRIEGNTFLNSASQYPAIGILELIYPSEFINSDPQTVSDNVFSQRYRTVHSSNGYYFDECLGTPPSGDPIRDLNNTITIFDDSSINLATENNVEQVFP